MDLVERARRLCAEGGSDRDLRTRLLAAIGHRVRFEGHVFAMTDPVSRVVSSPHATLPMVPADRLPELVAMRYRCRDRGQWSAWLRSEFGITDVTAIDLRDRYGGWGFLELWRTRTRFSDADRNTMRSLAQVLTEGLRGAVAATFAPQQQQASGRRSTKGGGAVEPGVVLLDRGLRVRSETNPAAAALLRLLPPDDGGSPVPAVAFNVGGALLASENPLFAQEGSADFVETPAWARVHLGEGRWMAARADWLGDSIAVSLSPCTAAERVDLFARSHGLSPRQVDVLARVLQGLDSRAIATSLTIAPTTAEDHLRALLAKTRSRSRQQLITRALDG